MPLLRDLLRDGLTARVEVTGHSMTPFVRRGDVVTLAPWRGEGPRIGEVVAYADGHRLVVHRIVGRTPESLLLRGDAAPSADSPVRPEQVLGIVTEVLRRGRPRRLGQGPERRLVAWLSREGALVRLARWRAGLAGRAISATA